MIGRFMSAMFGTLHRAFRAKNWPSAVEMMADFQEHHPPGFYSTEALEKTLCSRFTTLGYRHEFADLRHELYVTGTDIDSGEHLVFGDGEHQHAHICSTVAASCAIPVFFQPIRIGERDVVDGAISESNPVGIAIDHGARTLLFVNPMVPIRNDRSNVCIPATEGRCARIAEKGVGWIGDQATRLMRSSCAEVAMRNVHAMHPEVRVCVLEPSRDELPMFMHNIMSFSANLEYLEYGRECGRRYFAAAGSPIAQLFTPESRIANL
jgi:predicted acylesterase/phospholipase RssA